jgi:membrane protein DedA with SNARE-associated domain
MSAWIENLVTQYGTIAVFAGTAIEGETVAITGGLLAHRGLLQFWPVAAAAALGGYVSDLVIYFVGSRYRDAPRVQGLIGHPRLSGLVARLSRNLVLFALVFRFIPGLRTAGPLTLAAMGFPPLAYALCTAVSSAAWGTTGAALGYFLGRTIERVFGQLARVEHDLVIVLAVALPLAGAVHLLRRWIRRRAADNAGG